MSRVLWRQVLIAPCNVEIVLNVSGLLREKVTYIILRILFQYIYGESDFNKYIISQYNVEALILVCNIALKT